ncbi:MAG TPA: DNA recombination protein RmuC [Solirubrobacterales bacterium]|nr:DNA recombination protein RmuC [Solirubrobacterales bacterium]
MTLIAIVCIVGLIAAVAYAALKKAAADTAESRLREAEERLAAAADAEAELGTLKVEMRGRDERLAAEQRAMADRERQLAEVRAEQAKDRETVTEQAAELKLLQKKIHEFQEKQEDLARSTLEAAGSNRRIETTLLDWTRQIANPQGRGAFGELALRNQLISLGLEEGRDFERQARPGSDGLQRVDFIVQAGGPTVAIDSKLANDPGLSGLSDALAAGDPERLKLFGRKLRDHAKALAAKDYWRELERSPSLALMYVPVEGAMHALGALEEFDAAKFFNTHRVCVITPSQLALALILIAELCHAERKEEHVEELLSRGHAMADAFSKFLDNYAKLGKKLNESVNLFNGGAGMATTHGLVWQQIIKPLAEFTPSKSIESGIKEIEPPRDDVIDLAERYRDASEQMGQKSEAA